MGELNIKVEVKEDSEMVNAYQFGSHNKRGEKWVPWCTVNGQVITNNCFEEQPKHLPT